jgi:hypothetical protein
MDPVLDLCCPPSFPVVASTYREHSEWSDTGYGRSHVTSNSYLSLVHGNHWSPSYLWRYVCTFSSLLIANTNILAFIVGLICPHDGGFAIKVTEKVEDLVSVIFLPLYFALSGLSTNLGLLNDGITWAYVIGVISVAFAGKIIGGTLAARACKLVWRESMTIGVLMSCKGLVELIVLVSRLIHSYELKNSKRAVD